MQEKGKSGTARIVRAEDGEKITPFGLNMKILASADATGGALSAIVAEHEPGMGPPPHVHFSQEEMFYVLEGSYEVAIDGGAPSVIGPGSFVFLPRNTVHTFKNVGTTTARMLDMSLPGGQDRYFKEIHALAAGGGFSGEKVLEVSRRHDTNFPGK
jgi:quercetin dioxygenase-like cupin family protein